MPVLTFTAIYLAILITGANLVETVFAWPGVGQLIYQGTIYRDFAVIQAVVLLTAVIVVSVNFAVDITYGYMVALVTISFPPARSLGGVIGRDVRRSLQVEEGKFPLSPSS